MPHRNKRNNFFQSCREGMQGYAIIGFFSIVEATSKLSCMKAFVILSRTVGIPENKLKLNSKLAFPNYLQLKEWWEHGLWLETDHYLSLQGGVCKMLFVSRKIYQIPPLRFCNVLPFAHWQCVGSQFFHSLPFTFRWRRLILPLFSLKTMWSSPPLPPPPQKRKNLRPSPQARKMTGLLHREDHEAGIKLWMDLKEKIWASNSPMSWCRQGTQSW